MSTVSGTIHGIAEDGCVTLLSSVVDGTAVLPHDPMLLLPAPLCSLADLITRCDDTSTQVRIKISKAADNLCFAYFLLVLR